MNNANAIAQLDQAIAARGWTQNEAERRLGFPSGAIAAWRAGTKTPGAVPQTIMFRILGIEPESWFDEEDRTRFEDAKTAVDLPNTRARSAEAA